MRPIAVLAGVGLALGACHTLPSLTRSAHVACGLSRATQPSDTATLEIVLDSEARATIKQLDLEVGIPDIYARIRLDYLEVSCSSSNRGLRLQFSGAWTQPPFVQAGAGSHFARATVHAGSSVLADTVLDMTGPIYRSLKWTDKR